MPIFVQADNGLWLVLRWRNGPAPFGFLEKDSPPPALFSLFFKQKTLENQTVNRGLCTRSGT